MEQIKLPPRLALIAGLVPKGARLADVGTDHGLLPLYLLASGQIVSAVASDLRPGPLSRAEANAAGYGLESIRFCLCDGLDGIRPGEADTVVVAGMGGENIAGILRRAPWTWRGTLLLLQPMSRPEDLRRALAEMGIEITGEHLAEDNGRIYSVIAARGGTPCEHTPAEFYTGRYELISREPLFLPYIDALENKLDAALEGLSRSGKETDAGRAALLRSVREEIERMRCRHAEGI